MVLKLTNEEKILISAYENTLGEGVAEFIFIPNFKTERCHVMMRKPTGEETYETICFELPNLHRELVRDNHWYTDEEIFG